MRERGRAIRPARADEAAAISALAIASKAVWDYSDEQLAVFREELTLHAAALERGHAHVLDDDGGGLLGFYTLVRRPDERLELEHLFVSPDHLREGHGARLLAHACRAARAFGDDALVIQSDPNAEAFYLRYGATLLERIPSSIPGRSIPFLSIATDAPVALRGSG